MPKSKLLTILIAGLLAMSSASLFIRLAQAEGVSSLVIASYRLLIATIVLSIPAIKNKPIKELQALSLKEKILLVASGLFLALHFATWITSLEYTSILISAVLVTTTPIWIAAFSPLLLGEKTSPKTILGMSFAVAGGVIIAATGAGSSSSGLFSGGLLALTGALMAAGYLLIGRSVKDSLSLSTYLVAVYGIAGLILLLWALGAGVEMIGFSGKGYLFIALTGLIPQLIGHSLTNLALRELSASFVSITWLGEPIGSTILGMAILGEFPGPFQIIGSIIILLGILIASYAEKA